MKDIKLSKIMLRLHLLSSKSFQPFSVYVNKTFINNEHLKVESITQLSIEEHNRRDSTFYSPPFAVLPELEKAFASKPDLTKKTAKDLEWVGGRALDVFVHL